MIGSFRRLLLHGVAGVLMTTGSVSAADKPGALNLKTSRVVVFKDGYGLFVKEGSALTATNGTVFTDEAPTSATLGSFWLTGKDAPIESVVIGRTEKELREKKRGTCESVMEIVKANLGKAATVYREDGAALEGKLLSVLDAPPPPAPAPAPSFSPWSYSGRAWPASEESAAPENQARSTIGELFLLRTSQGDVLVRAKDVRSVRTENMITEVDREKVWTEPANHLTVRFREPRPNTARSVHLLYFRPGIRWIPTYQIDLGDKNEAALLLQAEVLNETEDLQDTPVDFVVGLPTFKFKDVVSPLTLERVLRNALESAAPQLMGQLAQQQSFSNAVFQSRNDLQAPAPGGSATGAEFSVAEKAMAGSEVQDLFYYSTQRLSLKRHERAAVGVFSAKVPFKHVYTWDVRLARGETFTESESPLRTEVNKVWHQIVLTNTSGLPWTTGPALVLQNGRPLGQDMLTFTPDRREVVLPVTAAVSVRGTLRVEEVSRIRHAEKYRGEPFARITNKATFKVTNSIKGEIHLVLTAQLGGKAAKPSNGGKVTITGHDPADGLEDLNPHSVVIWEMDLPAGKTSEVSCSYQFFQRE